MHRFTLCIRKVRTRTGSCGETRRTRRRGVRTGEQRNCWPFGCPCPIGAGAGSSPETDQASTAQRLPSGCSRVRCDVRDSVYVCKCVHVSECVVGLSAAECQERPPRPAVKCVFFIQDRTAGSLFKAPFGKGPWVS